MFIRSIGRRALLAAAASLFACFWPAAAGAAPVIFQAAGPNPAAIQSAVDAFRTQLGTLNPPAPGSLPSGRREINWDGGGSLATAISPSVFNGFQATRGTLFTTPGTGFIQAPTSGVATQLGNPTYATTFAPFSAARVFSPLGSNILDVTFFLPGTETPATTSGFGSIFSDVDLSNVTQMEFFDINNTLLYSRYVAASPGDASQSFLGVFFDAGEAISRVRITNGNSPLGPNDGGNVDVVVMDDYILAEPQPVPEPATMILLGTGLAGVAARVRRRRRA